ncbi:MAG: PsbP-related protein [Flavobacteriales bacterium]
MKNLIILVLLVSFIFSCSSSDKPVDELTAQDEKSTNNGLNANIYSNEQMNISFNYPDSWEVRTDTVNGILYILSSFKEGDDFQEMMNVVVGGTQGLNLEEFLSINLVAVEDMFEELVLTEEPTVYEINDREFKKVKYNYVSEGGGYPLTAGLFVTHANNKSYIINCSALQNTFDQYQEEFMSVVNSIQIK